MLRGGTVAAAGKRANYSSRVTWNNVFFEDVLLLGLPHLHWQHEECNPPSWGGIISLLAGEMRQAALGPHLSHPPLTHTPLPLSALGPLGLISLCPSFITGSPDRHITLIFCASIPHGSAYPLFRSHLPPFPSSFKVPSVTPSWSSAEPPWLQFLFWMTP